RLDQQPLPFITATGLAETNDDGASLATRLDAARQQSVSGRQELEAIEANTAQASWSRSFHHQQIAAAAAAMTDPLAVQRLYDHEFGWPARPLGQLLPLPLGKLGRNPMGSVQLFKSRISASAEAEELALRRARHIGSFGRNQSLLRRPGPEQLQGFGQACGIGLNTLFKRIGPPLLPTFEGVEHQPAYPHEYVDSAHVILACKTG